MKRNIKMLIAAIVVLGLLVAVYFALPKLLADKEETQAPQGEVAATDNNIYLINEETAKVESITFNNGEIVYTIVNGDVPSVEGYSSHVFDNSAVFMTLFNGTCVIADKVIEENATDLLKYGLDKEDKYVSVKLKDGSEKKVIIGSTTHMNGEYYAKITDDSTVHTISGYTAATLLKHPSEFRNLNVVEIENTTVSDINVKRGETQILDVRYVSTSTVSNQNLHVFKMQYPYKDVTANLDSINAFCQSLASVNATEIVEEDPDDLSKYGLDNPYILTVKDANRTSTIKMGTYAEDGEVYVMKGDVPVVFKAPCVFYENVKNVNADEFVERFVHLFNIKEVSGITVKNSESNYNITITKKSEDQYEYKINDKIKVKDTFTPIYTAIIGITSHSFLEEMPQGGKEYCTIKFTLNSKTTKSFTYYEYDERYCVVTADNGMVSLVTRTDVDAIFESLNK